MTRPLLKTVARYAADLAAEADAARPDADLLRRFADGDGTAFPILLRRHGPMVWAVCRQLLPNPADAEDAFQATFLALVKSARKVRSAAALGGWLHGVAVRAAKQIRRSAAQRKLREAKAAGPEAGCPVPDSRWDDLLAAVHAEVQRLPDGLRTAFVLCELEGVPQPDAAARLGWKAGTLTGRLCRARQRLLDRLTKQGFAPAVGAGFGVMAAGAAVPPDLAGRVISLAAAPTEASAAVSALVLEVTAMTWNRTKLIAAAFMAAGGLGVGVGTGWVANAGAQFPTSRDYTPPGVQPAGGAGATGADTGRGGPPSGPGTQGGGDTAAFTATTDTAVAGTSGDAAAPRPNRSPWEYKFENLPGSTDDFRTLVLNRANEGWELVASVELGSPPGQRGLTELVFKRPRPRSGGTGFGGMTGAMNPLGLLGGAATAPAPGGMGGGMMGMASGGSQPIGAPPMGAPPGMFGTVRGGGAAAATPTADFTIVTIALRNQSAVETARALEQVFNGSDVQGVVNYVPIASSNALIVSGSKARVEQARAVIQEIDAMPAAPVPPTVRGAAGPMGGGGSFGGPPMGSYSGPMGGGGGNRGLPPDLGGGQPSSGGPGGGSRP